MRTILFIFLFISTFNIIYCQDAPILTGGFTFVGQVYGTQVYVYWNNQPIFYAKSWQPNTKFEYYFYTTPLVGKNVFSIVMNKQATSSVYIDNVYLKYNSNNTNILKNGDFQTTNSGSWAEQSTYLRQQCSKCTSYCIQLKKAYNSLTQIVQFNSNYQNIPQPPLQLTKSNNFLVTFDYSLRIDRFKTSDTAHISFGDAQLDFSVSGFKKHKFSYIYNTYSQSSSIKISPSNPNICSLILVDNIKIFRIGSNDDMLKGDGTFDNGIQKVLVCETIQSGTGRWNTSNKKPFTITWGSVVNPYMYSNVFLICTDQIYHTF